MTDVNLIFAELASLSSEEFFELQGITSSSWVGHQTKAGAEWDPQQHKVRVQP